MHIFLGASQGSMPLLLPLIFRELSLSSLITLLAPHWANFALCFFPSRCSFRPASQVVLTWHSAQLQSLLSFCTFFGAVGSTIVSAFLFILGTFVFDEGA
jgi:hypothetical protein